MLVVSLKVPERYISGLVDVTRDIVKDKSGTRSLEKNPDHAHISLYVGIFPVSNKEKVINTVRDISSGFKPIEINPKGLGNKSGYVSISFYAKDDLMLFHKTLMNRLNPLREGLVKDIYTNSDVLKRLDPKEIENMKKWGYPYGFKNFNPHITLFKFEDERYAEEVASSFIDLSFLSDFKSEAVEMIFTEDKEYEERSREKIIIPFR